MPLIHINPESSSSQEQFLAFGAKGIASQENLYPNASMDQLIEGGTQYFITNGNWSMYDLLLRIADKICPRSPIEVFLTFYSMTELSARILAKLVDEKKISQLNLLYDRKSEIRYPNVHQILQGIARMKPLHVHAKLLVIRSRDAQDHITVVGSANWTRNPRVECGIYDTNPDNAEMFIQWFNQTLLS